MPKPDTSAEILPTKLLTRLTVLSVARACHVYACCHYLHSMDRIIEDSASQNPSLTRYTTGRERYQTRGCRVGSDRMRSTSVITKSLPLENRVSSYFAQWTTELTFRAGDDSFRNRALLDVRSPPTTY